MSACAMSSCALNRSPLIVAMPMLHWRWNTRSCSTCFTLRMSSSTCDATIFASLPRDVLQQHDELVAAEARHEILAAHAVADLLRRELQQLVAGRVAAGVVDVLELIEIDEEQRAAPLVRGAVRDLRLERRDQPMAVVQTRQRIVTREVQQMPLALLQRANRVVERRDDRLQLRVLRASGTRRPCRRAASCASGCCSSDSGASARFRNSRPPAHDTPSSSSKTPLASASRGRNTLSYAEKSRSTLTNPSSSIDVFAALGSKSNRPSPASDSRPDRARKAKAPAALDVLREQIRRRHAGLRRELRLRASASSGAAPASTTPDLSSDISVLPSARYHVTRSISGYFATKRSTPSTASCSS